jgi:hypothetical protein
MCDYSLHAVAARPPWLETHLSQSVFQAHPRVALPRAVCLLPGTELVFEDEVKYNRTIEQMRVDPDQELRLYRRPILQD